MENKIKIDILPNYFLNSDGTFNKEDAINLSGKIAGICYAKDGYETLKDEDVSKTKRRVDLTLNNGHHSVYDHIMISLNIKNIPKILAMVLNNEHQYITSEKSLRYTPIVSNNLISSGEVILYNKWIDIFFKRIKDTYGNIYDDKKITKLAQENARYMVSVFIPTEMVYTTSLRQINYIVSWLNNYINNCDKNDYFENKLSLSMKELVAELDKINLLEEGLMKNDKERSISLFGSNLDKKDDYFSDIYQTTYLASFACLAQAHRHRTLDYKMELLDDAKFFVPPIIMDDEKLVDEWLVDIHSVKDIYPQGMLIRVYESGKYEDFILKCKERLCTGAQLEVCNQTRDTLLKYRDSLEDSNHPLKDDVKKYIRGARCTFKDFCCTSDCKFKEGKTLTRKI